MAGHSQFKNIMHRKGRVDAVRSKVFSKLAREITVAAKLGTPDPSMNPRLRAAILAARAENMPKDNIERAIAKGTGGGGDADALEHITYEGYGAGGVAMLVEAYMPMPGQAKMRSITRRPASRAPTWIAIMASVPFMQLRTVCLRSTRVSLSPFDRAVRT